MENIQNKKLGKVRSFGRILQILRGNGQTSVGKMEPSGFSKALGLLNSHNATSGAPHTTVPTLSSAERKLMEAYQFQVEKRRVMAMELARRDTYR